MRPKSGSQVQHLTGKTLQQMESYILENADDLALFKANEGFKPDAI